ncbi:hypothetical protein ACXYMT_02505 [Salinimicrobium sp. CAU 1759]
MIFKQLVKLFAQKDSSVPVQKLQQLKNKNRQEGARLNEISENNISGIELEKVGEIDEAIQKYENNISNRVVASHSYDRLMIIYRKRKQYQDEIRVIKAAIGVFSDENHSRYQRAIKRASTGELKKLIEAGHQRGEKVQGLDGTVIYNPYPVQTYKQRLVKRSKE